MGIIKAVSVRLNGHRTAGVDIEQYLDSAEYEGNLDHGMCVLRDSVVELDIELVNGEGAWVVGPDYVSVLEHVHDRWAHLYHELLDIPYETLQTIEDTTDQRFDFHYTFVDDLDPGNLMAGGIRVMDFFPSNEMDQILREVGLAGYVALIEGENSYFISTNLPGNLIVVAEELRKNAVTQMEEEE